MDEEAVRAALQHYFDCSATNEDVAHKIYHADAVLEFPQSGERFEGVANFREWRRIYPGEVDFGIRRMQGGDGLWVVVELRDLIQGPVPGRRPLAVPSPNAFACDIRSRLVA